MASITYDKRYHYYGSRALLMSPQELSEWILPLMPPGLRFDTLVGTGLSGTIAIVKLASLWETHAAFIRKSSESTHSSHIIEGSIGKQWLFIDDIISTALTVRRCAEIMSREAPNACCVGGILYGDTYATAQFVDKDRMEFFGAVI